MLKIQGYRLLVKAKEIERVSKGGIILNVEGTNDDKLEQTGNQFGTVIGVGHTCWKGGPDETPWCKVGDMICYSKHAGRFIYDPETEDPYLIINDDDVICVITDGDKDV